LKEAGIVNGYHARVNLTELGLPLLFFVRMTVTGGGNLMAGVVHAAEQMPEVIECHRVTGEDCFILNTQLSLGRASGIADQAAVTTGSDHNVHGAFFTHSSAGYLFEEPGKFSLAGLLSFLVPGAFHFALSVPAFASFSALRIAS
jgi:hypothetical protein